MPYVNKNCQKFVSQLILLNLRDLLIKGMDYCYSEARKLPFHKRFTPCLISVVQSVLTVDCIGRTDMRRELQPLGGHYYSTMVVAEILGVYPCRLPAKPPLRGREEPTIKRWTGWGKLNRFMTLGGHQRLPRLLDSRTRRENQLQSRTHSYTCPDRKTRGAA